MPRKLEPDRHPRAHGARRARIAAVNPRNDELIVALVRKVLPVESEGPARRLVSRPQPRQGVGILSVLWGLPLVVVRPSDRGELARGKPALPGAVGDLQ